MSRGESSTPLFRARPWGVIISKYGSMPSVRIHFHRLGSSAMFWRQITVLSAILDVADG